MTLNYDNWGSGDPNNVNQNEHCILLNLNLDWLDLDCKRRKYGQWQYRPICKEELRMPSTGTLQMF